MSISLTVSATSKQILLSYNVPAGSEATVSTIEVSESATYTPLVNDVNGSLFSGANSDNRPGSIGTGTASRAIVIGTIQPPAGTLSNLAADGNRYGRLLQPNTTHYVRVTCGADVGTTTVTTKNRPLGITRADERPIASAGTNAYPNLVNSTRTQTLSDPSTGIKLRKLTVPTEDTTGGNIYNQGSGAPWPYSQSTLNDSSGTPGYIVAWPTENGTTRLYFLTDTESRFLGTVFLFGGTITDFGSGTYFGAMNPAFGANPRELFYVSPDSNGNAHILKCTLPASGSTYYDTSQASGAIANCSFSNASDMTPSPNHLTKKLQDFATAGGDTFDTTKFANYANPFVQGNYVVFTVLRGSQDSYGWLGAADITTNPATVAGFFPLWKRGGSGALSFRWCGIHTAHPVLDSSGTGNKVSWTSKTGYQDIKGSYFTTTLNGAITNSQNTITVVSNTPLGNDGSGYTENMGYGIAAGDEIWIDSERILIGSFVSGTTWNVSRGQFGSAAVSHINGSVVLMACRCHQPGDVGQVGPSWWNVSNDPRGTDTTGTNLITQLANANVYNAHEGFANGRGISENGYSAFIGPAMTNNTVFVISDSPTFAGASKTAGGNSWQKHNGPPQQSTADVSQSLVWGTDSVALDADVELSATSLTNITGFLWKFANTNYALNRKQLPMLAVAGSKPLLDISSTATGNVIGGLAADNYKYCVANAVNECRTGSAIGDIYINGPDITAASTCYGNWTYATTTGLCFGHIPAIGGGIVQIGIVEANSTGKWYRVLTDGLMPPKMMSIGADSHPTPDGKWMSIYHSDPSGTPSILLAKVPPWPGYDGIDRNTFQQKAITVAAVGGADNAIIEFGYDTSFFCTSRQEVCVSAASNNPYFFASESFTGVPCTSGCTINIPMIPDRTVYYRIKWRNGSTLVQTSGTFATAEDSAPIGGGDTGGSGNVTVSNVRLFIQVI